MQIGISIKYSLPGQMLNTFNSREQAIENYKSLLKKKKDLSRKNRALQTKIAQHARKNKLDLGNEGWQFDSLCCSHFSWKPSTG